MPTVWLQAGRHHGDNEQVRALGALLRRRFGWDIMEISTTAELQPPWPDLVIGAGYRTVEAAIKIKNESGGNTKLVRIGRPRYMISSFDLIVTTRQYGLGGNSNGNVVMLTLPLASEIIDTPTIDHENISALLKDLPKPFYLLIIGGPTKTNRLDLENVDDFLRTSLTKVKKSGGAAIIITSPRTPQYFINHIKNWHFAAPHQMFFHVKDQPNPYRFLLNEADYVCSTGESASISADAIRAGKGLFIAEPVSTTNRPLRNLLWNRYLGHKEKGQMNVFFRLVDFVVARGWIIPHRSMERLRDHLITVGLAAPLESAAAPPPDNKLLENETEMLLFRLHGIMKERKEA